MSDSNKGFIPIHDLQVAAQVNAESANRGEFVSAVKEVGDSAFRMLKCDLKPGDTLIVESGAMASQDVGIVPTTLMNGGFLNALIAKFLGKESFFINYFTNKSSRMQTMFLTQTTPGDIVNQVLNGETIFIERGSFIARTPGVSQQVVWAGLASFLAGEGLFKLAFSGRGTIWYGCYGSVIEKEITGDYIVDSGHLLSYPSTIQLSLKLSGGIFSSIFSGEGLVLKLSGHGKIQLQTRSVSGLAQWLNPRFW